MHCNATSASDCASSKCKIQLSNDLQLHYRIHLSDEYNDDASTECKSCKIEVQLLYDGFTWLGIGLSNDGEMEGSHAIIGQPGIADPTSYYLKEMDINALERTNVKMTNKNIDFIDGRTIMDFTVHFADWGALVDKGAGISLLSPTTFIWAHGNDGEEQFIYHGPNNKKSYTVDDLLVSTEHSDLFKTKSVQQNQNSGAWKAHGILAFIAWAILAPFAISVAIMRDIEVPSRFKELAASKLHLLSKLKENWLRIHIVLNSFVCVMTMLVFIIAVVNVNKESGMPHWFYAHSKMGLAMFILSCNQVLGGYLRPSKDTTQEKNGEESSNGEIGNSNDGEENGISNENGDEDAGEERKVFPMKSFGRQAWELLHHILGLALFLFATWQMFEGIELYHMKYGTSGGAAAVILGLYILWIAVWLCIIIGGTVYKWYMQTRRLVSDDNGDDDDKKIEGDACSDLEMKEIS